MNPPPKHYAAPCGCLYAIGGSEPWNTCPTHFAEKIKFQRTSRQGTPATTLQKSATPPVQFISKIKTRNYPIINSATAHFIPIIPTGDNKRRSHYWVYALLLEHKKYYVGITAKVNPYHRILQHGDIFGAKWTLKYPPIDVLEIKDIGNLTRSQAESIEQDLTITYAKIYGTNNVRGGAILYPGTVFRIGKLFISFRSIFKILSTFTYILFLLLIAVIALSSIWL